MRRRGRGGPMVNRIDRTLRVLALIVSAGYVALYAVLAWLRVAYPYELEWLEGACVDHVRTILSGRPLYDRPSLQFIPLTYTPGYFYLAAGLTKIVGVGLVPLRLISIAASGGLLLTIYALASHEAGSRRAGVLAAGLFAATYGWTDGWFDLARTDSLFLFLACLGIFVLRTRASTPAAAGAATLLALAFLVKQTGLVVAIPLAAVCAWRGWQPCAAYVLTLAAIVGGSTLVLDRAFDGWYRYYVFAVPKQHPLALDMLWGFWRFDLLRPLPIATAGAAAAFAWTIYRRNWDRAIFYAAAGAGLFGGALASRLHSLSYVNVVLPAYAAVCVLFAVAVRESWRLPRTSPSARLLPLAASLLAVLQLARLAYAPARFVPTAEDVAGGDALIQRLSDMPGEVWTPYHGWLPTRAGKDSAAHAVVIADVIRGGTSDADRALAAEIDEALRTHRYSSIVAIDAFTPVRAWLPLDRYYRPAEPVVERRSRFWRREVRYVPRTEPTGQ